jgi:hypothetical protein
MSRLCPAAPCRSRLPQLPGTAACHSRFADPSVTAIPHSCPPSPCYGCLTRQPVAAAHSGLSPYPTPISLGRLSELPVPTIRDGWLPQLSATPICPGCPSSSSAHGRLPAARRARPPGEAACHGWCRNEPSHLLVGAAGLGRRLQRYDTSASLAHPSPRSATAVRHGCPSRRSMAALTHSSLSLMFPTAVCCGCPSQPSDSGARHRYASQLSGVVGCGICPSRPHAVAICHGRIPSPAVAAGRRRPLPRPSFTPACRAVARSSCSRPSAPAISEGRLPGPSLTIACSAASPPVSSQLLATGVRPVPPVRPVCPVRPVPP